jgi:hypothetical protein
MAALAAAAALLPYVAASRLGRPSWRTTPLRGGGRGAASAALILTIAENLLGMPAGSP